MGGDGDWGGGGVEDVVKMDVGGDGDVGGDRDVGGDEDVCGDGEVGGDEDVFGCLGIWLKMRLELGLS